MNALFTAIHTATFTFAAFIAFHQIVDPHPGYAPLITIVTLITAIDALRSRHVHRHSNNS